MTPEFFCQVGHAMIRMASGFAMTFGEFCDARGLDEERADRYWDFYFDLWVYGKRAAVRNAKLRTTRKESANA